MGTVRRTRSALAIAERLATVVCRLLAIAGLLMLLPFAALSVLDGLMREFAGQPIDVVRDFSSVVLAIAIACCMPAGLLDRSHVSLRLLESAAGARAGLFFDAVASILLAVTMGAMAREFVLYSGKLLAGGQVTFLLAVHTWPFWYVVTAVLWVAVLVQVLVATVTVARLFGREPAVDCSSQHGKVDLT